jgi:starch phosphorylase
VAPLFYERDQENLPLRWIAKMKTSMKRLCPIFNTNRMVMEYAERFYLPAAKRYSDLAAHGGAKLGPILEWRKRFRTAGSQVKITRVQTENSRELRVGEKMRVTAHVVLGEIPPEYVRVQIVSGSVNAAGVIVNSTSNDMKHAGMTDNEHLYDGQLECLESGSYGFSVRVIPYHPDVRVPVEHPWLVWAE